MLILSPRFRKWWHRATRPRAPAGVLPLRAELLSGDPLARHAETLATGHRVVTRPHANRLLVSLTENERSLRAFNRETIAVNSGRRITPAAEWLLDNFYLIEEQIHLARRHLPRGYSRELPRLLNGASAGLPRVYDLGLEMIAHVDAQIDAGPLRAFVAAYQSVSVLKLGELWAIPIMLRLGLIENLRRITNRLTVARHHRDLADAWVDRLQAMAEKDPSQVVIVVAEMAKSDLPLTTSFVAEFCHRLARQSPVLHLARTWLEERLVGQGLSVEQLVHEESQNQAADQVSVSHSIASFRFLGATDWKDFVEATSAVEQILRTDPANVYATMDFATRDGYRHAVESVARRSHCSESDVAHAAIRLTADRAVKNGRTDRTAHIGYFLVDDGDAALGRAVAMRTAWRGLPAQIIRRWPLAFYLGGIFGLTTLATLGFVLGARASEVRSWPLVVFAALFMVCCSQLAVAVMNRLAMAWVKPRRLPRLDFSAGIPAEHRTMVVVPTMLASLPGVDRLVESLEIHALANRGPHLHFALLTDFCDAATETVPGDEALLRRAEAGIAALNRKYPIPDSGRFFLAHRARRWNASEGRWMGYERKRGKLAQFNALLRGGAADGFSSVVGATEIFPTINYIITLDTDTQLPQDAAGQLAGTMAHPLNRPVFDPVRGIVVEGYGILQPRVGVSLPGARRSWFVRLLAGEAGIDPYTREVSDVYQDLFHEGSFIGKGIYDVDAFERALHGRCPENAVLSHDLLEACHARSGLVSDVELYEDHPARINVDVARRHRWMRGDWQISPWLWSRVPGAEAGRLTNPLSTLSQWKIVDNLRRSLVPIALVLFLAGSWVLLPAFGAWAVLLVLALVFGPGAWACGLHVADKPGDLPWAMHWRAAASAGARQFAQAALTLTFLPYEAGVSVDAIGRTAVRMAVTRRRLLEWRTSGEVERTCGSGLAACYRTMIVAPLVAVALATYLALMSAGSLAWVWPCLVLWLVSPVVAWWISRPIPSAEVALSADQTAFLHRTARTTWHFFETFVTARENWLPPDNFQEIPTPVIASRTSPTNMGFALLANLAAADFGYLSIGGVMRRTHDTLAAMQRLERHRGHFFNWYDTLTLEPLLPRYVSSVDSGNLASHLLTLAAGLREAGNAKIYAPQIFSGLRDTVRVWRELAPENYPLAQFETDVAQAPAGLRAAFALLQRVAERAAQAATPTAQAPEASRKWAEILQRTCAEHLAELLHLAPWLALAPPDRGSRREQRLVELDRGPTVREIAGWELEAEAPDPADGADPEFGRCLRAAGEHARERWATLESLARTSEELAAMDFAFLFDRARDLFSTGYNVTERRADTGYYDLLASEARMCSFVAIALGQVGQKHWFSLGRLLVANRGEPMLVSWSGSMFEYLMPLLVTPHYPHTLLGHTCHAAVQQQINYGRVRGVPWGISESGYYRTDARHNYQYRAFGVPGLGLKRGLADDLVVAPYASAMALLLAPRAACENLQRLAAEGRAGEYGFYEAIDYTPARLPPGETSVAIRSFMVHHQGMSLLALVSVLRDQPMQRRFLACPALKAAELLLQERVPQTAASVLAGDLEIENIRPLSAEAENVLRVISNPSGSAPDVHLLSNGRYHVVITGAGGGYSRWRGLALTRWREDATRDSWGMFAYIRDLETGEFLSAAFQPALRATKGYEAIFTQARAEFRQSHGGLELHTEISVSSEDDVELRRITITNRSAVARLIELTSYAEVVLAAPEADAAHPAFSNLFVQTEWLPAASGLLCTRRARSPEEKPPWLVHLLVGPSSDQGEVSCETDRARFIGRGGSLVNPAALQTKTPLSGSVGPVLDPIVSLRRTVALPPHETVTITLLLGVAETREAVVALAEKYQGARMVDRAFDLAWTHSQVTLRQLHATDGEAQLYARMAGALIYADPARRAGPGVLRSNRRGQSGLWSYGVSGDAPLVLLRISDPAKIEIVNQLIRAHAFWRMKGLTVELIILNEDVSVYRQSLHDQITQLVATGTEVLLLDKPGGIFVRRLEQVPAEDRVLLQAAARLVLDDESGTLVEQMERPSVPELAVPLLTATRAPVNDAPVPVAGRDLIFANGLGGFTRDGHEYVITLQPGQVTPAPWVNVIANPNFGTVVSESGSTYTWAENAHEFRLTPWSNDPVQDMPGEACYLRDEQTGEFWSPMPAPTRGATPYVIRHGFGYTVFEHTENGIASEVWIYVAMDAPVKFTVVKLRNVSGRPRRVSVTGYWEWVFGDLRPKSLLHVQTSVELMTGALLARNYYNTEFPDRIAFVDVHDVARTVTGDRKEFIGRNGNLARPAALKRARLSGRVGVGLDPGGAVQVAYDFAEEEEREITFRFGVGRNAADVQYLIQRFRRAGAVRSALEGVWTHWNRTLGAVNVDTPDPAVNVMVNGWLLYQTLSCRVWGRTGFYQSGGAYGFRDQLQDVMALVHAEPTLTREHLLRAAAHQFREGDVQHWWHPPSGRGVRTHFSDDLLWLPYVTCRYVTCVADTGVLDEKISLLEGRAVQPEEEAYYDRPNRSDESVTLYEHCVRAIERGLKFGAHGLPLIGCGDWNDGMNRVGHEGKGESVWLAFFLYDVLHQFSAVAQQRGEGAFARRCLDQAEQLQANIERHAWDGAWYRRAYFDNGEPLGAQANTECQIDSLPQSWAVLSGAGDPVRARQAMESVDQRLVRRETGIVQLFDPPFDRSPLNPGYIKGYIPGVRENGGQYTHGAIWAAMAFARMGDGERAWELCALLNPVNHSATAPQIATYKVEPYVVAADVYAVAPHTGRGGWTWYTGSAGWMYRLMVETLLGVNREGEQLRLAPQLPKAWGSFKVHYRYRKTVYHITIGRLAADSVGESSLTIDGRIAASVVIPLLDDGQEHAVNFNVR